MTNYVTVQRNTTNTIASFSSPFLSFLLSSSLLLSSPPLTSLISFSFLPSPFLSSGLVLSRRPADRLASFLAMGRDTLATHTRHAGLPLRAARCREQTRGGRPENQSKEQCKEKSEVRRRFFLSCRKGYCRSTYLPPFTRRRGRQATRGRGGDGGEMVSVSTPHTPLSRDRYLG